VLGVKLYGDLRLAHGWVDLSTRLGVQASAILGTRPGALPVGAVDGRNIDHSTTPPSR
jgi:hypothetical protein